MEYVSLNVLDDSKGSVACYINIENIPRIYEIVSKAVFRISIKFDNSQRKSISKQQHCLQEKLKSPYKT